MRVNKFTISVLFLVILYLIAFALATLNNDYLKPLTEVGTNEPTDVPPPAEPIQIPPIVNPDGTKSYAVAPSLHIRITFEISGSYLSHSKYIAFTFGITLMNILEELVEQLAEHVRDITMFIVALLAFIHIQKGHSRITE